MAPTAAGVPSQRTSTPGLTGAPAVARSSAVDWLRSVSLASALVSLGAVLLPAGLIVIVLGWYGVANSAYTYDQLTYLISGGLLGLALTFTGGFLLFGAWVLQLGRDQRSSATDTIAALRQLVALQAHPEVPDASRDALVTVGRGRTLHRRDCGLISDREDLHPAFDESPGLVTCRVCAPAVAQSPK